MSIEQEQERLKKKIEDTQKELRNLEEKEKFSKRNEAIKNLEDYSESEKIEWFNEMYKSAMEELEERERDGYSNEDYPNYVWETYIQILARKNNNSDFWNYWNSLEK